MQAGLAELPLLPVDRAGAAILRRGQTLLVRGPAPTQGPACAHCFGTPIAFGVVEDGYFVSTRVFNSRDRLAHFHASNAFASIASPSDDFWNTSFAMRLSLSSSGKSNQARVCIRSRLRAVS